MALPTEALTKLTEGSTDALLIAALAFVALVLMKAFVYMRGALPDKSIERRGNTYDFDESYEPKVAKYAYHDGFRYKLREDGEEELDDLAEPDETGETWDKQEMNDENWEQEVERSRSQNNGEKC